VLLCLVLPFGCITVTKTAALFDGSTATRQELQHVLEGTHAHEVEDIQVRPSKGSGTLLPNF
jgi:hypothetical protein